MAEVCLQRPGVVAPIGQRVAACVLQHVRAGLEPKLGRYASPLDHAGKPCRSKRRATL